MPNFLKYGSVVELRLVLLSLVICYFWWSPGRRLSSRVFGETLSTSLLELFFKGYTWCT